MPISRLHQLYHKTAPRPPCFGEHSARSNRAGGASKFGPADCLQTPLALDTLAHRTG